MERFIDELLPRDLLSKAIKKQMKKDGTKFVWLSIKELGSEEIKKRFPNGNSKKFTPKRFVVIQMN